MKMIVSALLFSIASIYVSAQSGLIAYYPFTNNGNDESGNGNNGTLYGIATANDTLETGNNSTDYFSIPSTVINGLEDFTVSFKVKFGMLQTSGSAPGNCIFHAWNSSLNQDALKITYDINNSEWKVGVNTVEYVFGFSALADEWYCITIVRVGSSLKFYLNGDQLGSPQSVSTTPISAALNGIVVGQEQDCVGGCFVTNQSMAGKLDDLKIYGEALTGADSEEVCISCKTLVNYPFTVDASDSSSNAYNGSLNGNAIISNGFLTIGDNDVDYLAVPADVVNGLSDFSISFKVRFDTFNVSGISPGNTIFHGWGSTEDELKISYNFNISMLQVSINGPEYTFPFTAQLGHWYCITIIRSVDTLKSYVDNLMIGIPSIVGVDGLSVSSSGVVVGQEQDCLGGCFASNQSLAGSLDYLIINNCGIILNEEQCEFGSGIATTIPSLFSLFPNPADEFVKINFPESRRVTLSVFNMHGEEVMKKVSANSKELILPTRNLLPGIYSLELYDGNRNFSQRLVVDH